MHAIEFLRNPAAGGVRPVYAVSGDDAYLRREALRAIVRAAVGGEDDELAVARFAGDQAALADVLDEVRTLPFLAKSRVAIVEGADPFVTAHRKELEAYVERPSASGVLVLSLKAWPGNTKLAKLVDQKGLAVDCKTPGERELPSWLVGLAKTRCAAKLDPGAAAVQVELVGPMIGLLASEVEKLATYAGDRKAITRDEVTRLVGAGRVETFWKALDAATTGRWAKALDDLDRLIAAGEHPVVLQAAEARREEEDPGPHPAPGQVKHHRRHLPHAQGRPEHARPLPRRGEAAMLGRSRTAPQLKRFDPHVGAGSRVSYGRRSRRQAETAKRRVLVKSLPSGPMKAA